MFDFLKWRTWLQERTNELRKEGFEADFRAGPDDSPKPGMAIGIFGLKAMADFQSWITGETDFTVMVPRSRDAKMVSHKWGLLLTDETFEKTFIEFMAEFRKFEISN